MNGFYLGEEMECQSLLWNHIYAEMDTAVLKFANKLRLFEAMHSHGGGGGGGKLPISLSDLAAALSLPSHRRTNLHRIMRYLSYMRLVNIHREAPETEEAETYTLTPTASAYLLEASEKSHSAFLEFFYNGELLSKVLKLDMCFAKQEIPQSHIFFEALGKDPKQSKMFNDAMSCTARPVAEALVRDCPEVFEGVRALVDVGGGNGIMASAVARAFPNIKCVVYDLGYVFADAPTLDGIRYQVGDMFVSVPQADVLLLARVLHDWNDEKALEILKRCREAVNEENGKLIIVDVVLDENDSKELQHVKLGFDILMMALVSGKERTEKEWRSLLLQAGFSSCSFKRIKALPHVIEATP